MQTKTYHFLSNYFEIFIRISRIFTYQVYISSLIYLYSVITNMKNNNNLEVALKISF